MKKQTVLIVILILLLLAEVGGAIWFVNKTKKSSEPSPSPTADEEPSPSPSLSPSPSPSPSQTAGSESRTDAGLQKILETFASDKDSKWDIYARSLSDGSYAAAYANIKSGQQMVSASLIKLFIMGAVYEKIDAGSISHDDVYASLQKMITISDNNAANYLVKTLGGGSAAAGMKAVNAFADSIGCSDSRQNRLMLDDNGLQNYTTAKDCAVILGLIYSGKCVSEKWSAEMLSLLKAQTVNNRLPASLPSGTVTAHKTGDLAKLSCGDVGIIYSPACDYILCAICNDPYSDDGAAKAIAELSRQVYDYYN